MVSNAPQRNCIDIHCCNSALLFHQKLRNPKIQRLKHTSVQIHTDSPILGVGAFYKTLAA